MHPLPLLQGNNNFDMFLRHINRNLLGDIAFDAFFDFLSNDVCIRTNTRLLTNSVLFHSEDLYFPYCLRISRIDICGALQNCITQHSFLCICVFVRLTICTLLICPISSTVKLRWNYLIENHDLKDSLK